MKTISLILWGFVAGFVLIPGTATAQEPPGRSLYEKHCRICHGPVGGPPAPAMQKQMGVPDLYAPGFLAARSDDSVVTVMEKGAGKFMKPLASTLKKEEMQAILRFLRESAPASPASRP